MIRIATFGLAILLPTIVAAQDLQRDVLAGHVLGPRGPIANATVIVSVVGGPGGSRSARTDAEGRWLVAVQEGTGDYLVRAIAIGFKPIQVPAHRAALQKPIMLDIKLEALPLTLDTVRVVSAPRPRPPREIQAQDRSGSDRATDATRGAIATGDQGNLTAMAGSVPGVLGLPDGGFSVLGLSADQNRVTINGLAFGATDIPRDAIAATRVASTTYDVSRGGFSGAQMSVTLAPGGNYHTRLAHITIDDPSLQSTDPVGRSLGSRYANTQVSGAVAGPIKLDKIFYNASFQLGRRTSDLSSLVTNDPLALQRVGVARDSVTRLVGLLDARGLPFSAARVPADRLTDNASILSRFDWFRSPTAFANLTVSGRRNVARASFLGATAAPGHGGDITTTGADVIAALSTYLPSNALNDLRIGARISQVTSDPYLDMPDVRLLVTSDFADSTRGSTILQFGGNPALPRDSRTWGLQVYDVFSQSSVDRTHRLRATLDLRADGLTQQQYANRRGTYTFNSLADFELNRPSSFSRSFVAQQARANALTGSFSLGDDFRPRDRVQMMYGVRIDANRIGDTPPRNTDVETRFGVRTDRAPRVIDISPRFGFFRAFGTNGTSGIPGFGAPWGNIRGGIGMFRNDIPTTLITPALLASGASTDATGLRQIVCIGSAIPLPDWNAFSADASAIPTRCADTTATSPLTSTRSNVWLIDERFAAQRSWRANLALNAFVVPKLIRMTVEGVYSLNLNQQSTLDLNFNPIQRFALTNEGNRPVYVTSANIVPASGAMTNRDSRRDAAYGSVTSMRSDMRSEARQLIVTVFPAPGDALGRFTQWNASYAYQHVHDGARGFGSAGGTGGNPLTMDWGRSALDARHQVTLSLSTRIGSWVSLATSAHFASGLPFTPMVAADVNGDGTWNDRAFIFDPTTADSSIGTAMRSLLTSSNSRVRDCLTRQTGRIAARSSCDGPWTGTMNAMLILNPEKLGWQNRTQLSLSLTNVLAGVDQLAHGSSHLQGWGQSGTGDPTLLTVRGFDPATNRFTYDVNPRFGDTRPSRVGVRAPFQLTLEARVQLGRDYTAQAIDQTLSPGRTKQGDRVTFAQMKGGLLTTVYNPVRGLLQSKDSLTILTNDQLRQLTALDARVTARQDSIVTPLAHYMADLGESFDRADVARRLLAVQNALFATVIDGMRQAREIFSPEQINEFPPFLRASFDIRRLMAARPVAGFEPDW